MHSKSVEGLLSTGPTQSSFHLISKYLNIVYFLQIFFKNITLRWRERGRRAYNTNQICSQLFQPLGEKLSYYNGKWFPSHHFGFKGSRKLKL